MKGKLMHIFQWHLKNPNTKLKYQNKEVFVNIFQSQCDLENKMEKVQSIFIKEGNNEEIALKGDGLKQKIEMREKQEKTLQR